jgi:hypothetical protein
VAGVLTGEVERNWAEKPHHKYYTQRCTGGCCKRLFERLGIDVTSLDCPILGLCWSSLAFRAADCAYVGREIERQRRRSRRREGQ